MSNYMFAASMGAVAGANAHADGAERGLAAALRAVENQRKQIAALELALGVQKAHAAGLDAQLDAFIEAHKSSPVRSDSGKRYKSGKAKSIGRIAYEKAFDSIAILAGIRNPAEYRTD